MTLGHSALIGYTGFVGSNLDRQTEFSDKFNSKNIADIEGRHFDLIVCAGVQAVKWWANQNPEADWAGIKPLLDRLAAGVSADRFVLISTVDVYPRPVEVNEYDDPRGQANHAYGRHRLAIEDFVLEQFGPDRSLIVRLPGVFGPGLKKNAVYDLIHDNQLEAIDPAAAFQWYDLGDLWPDIQIAVEHDLGLINLAVEPVATSEIVSRIFPEKADLVGGATETKPPARYDFRSIHAEIWSGRDGYLRSRDEVLDRLGRFVAEQLNQL